jgi:hypothetical protein
MFDEDQAVILYDSAQRELAVQDGVAIPANTPALLISGADSSGNAKRLLLDSNQQLRTAAAPPQPPDGTTEFVLAVPDVDLELDGDASPGDTLSAVIGNGTNLFIQSVSGGAAGDPTERGSRIDILWQEGAGPTYHVIARYYVGGQTVAVTFADINKARDGTQLQGNGSNTRLVIRRYRLSNGAQEVDAEVRGYLS